MVYSRRYRNTNMIKQTGDCREKFFSSLQEMLFIPAFSVVYEVIMRGMFNSPTEWVVEISTYCVTIAGFLGMAVTFVANKHIKVDILLSHLSKRTNEILSVLTSFIGMVFCGVVTIYAIGMVAMSLEHGMRLPRCVPRCGFRSLRCPSGLASCSCILSGHSWKT